MSTQLKLRRGTTTQHSTFTGAEGEITVDTTKDTVVVHDGATAGGFPLAKESTVTALDSAAVHKTGDETVSGTKTFSSNPVYSAGTANGVAYLNGSKVLTTGSALTFDGSTLNLTNTTIASITLNNASGNYLYATAASENLYLDNRASGTFNCRGNGTFTWSTYGGSEQMRLTSTGLGIGTSSITSKLTVNGDIRSYYPSNNTFYSVFDCRDGNAYVGGAGPGSYLYLVTNNTVKATLDHTGNLGLGVTPSAWRSGDKAFDIGATGTIYYQNANATLFGNNFYRNSINQLIYKQSAAAGYMNVESGFSWHIAPSGTAGNTISFTQAMTLDASGNLTLGKTSADGKLDIAGITGAGAHSFVIGYGANGDNYYTSGSSGIHVFRASSSERMRLDSSGNLGLGVTPSAWGSGTRVFNFGNAGVIGHQNANGYTVFANNYYNNSGDKYIQNGYATRYWQIDGKHGWDIAPSGTAGNAISFTQAMTLDASGNLGIGTTSPNINVWNTGVTINSSGGSGYAALEFAAAGQLQAFIFSRGGNQFNISSKANIPLVFGTNDTERMRIDSSGNVLVTGTGGLGYGTGSGGAVTQATSRTTGVTLNKTNGAITLVSAAGSATYQSFTVTNSTVAATDTVIVNQKSGTDLYEVFVTAVAAGSFRITFATTGGTTTEQPVFNFAVIKAVTS